MKLLPAHSAYNASPHQPDRLDLAWAPDEQELLDADIPGTIRQVLAGEQASLELTSAYPLSDPFGSASLLAAVTEHFGIDPAAVDVATGAGVGGLLHDLSRLASRRDLVLSTAVYPNLPFWAHAAGSRIRPALWSGTPAMYALERPEFGGPGMDLEGLEELCERAQVQGALVVVDESNANYYPPSFSAVRLERVS